MHEYAAIRPRLRQDTVFLLHPEGLLFRNEDKYLHLKGKAAAKLITRLSPYLNGDYTLEELCSNFEPEQRPLIMKLLQALLTKGLLRNVPSEPAELLTSAVRQHFSSQIAFLSHYTDTPLAAFKAFRESKILLLGSGDAFLALGRSLLRNGLRRLQFAPADTERAFREAFAAEVALLAQGNTEAELCAIDPQTLHKAEDLRSYDLVVYCAEDGSPRTILEWQARCLETDIPFLPAYGFTGLLTIGPLVKRGGPCWLCAQMRLSSNRGDRYAAAFWSALSLGDDLNQGHFPIFFPTAQMLGIGAGFELFKILSSGPTPETLGGVILQNAETLEVTREALLPHPLCPLCASADPADTSAQLRAVAAGEWGQEISGHEQLLQGLSLVSPCFGVFKEFQDEHIEQLPLRCSQLVLNLPHGYGDEQVTVTAYHSEHLDEARRVALQEAVRRYTLSLPNTRRMLKASLEEMQGYGYPICHPCECATWRGITCVEEQRPGWWLPTYSLSTQDVCYVPAAAVYPFTGLNRGEFERTLAGSAVGPTFAALLSEGLSSALAYIQVQRLLRGQDALRHYVKAMNWEPDHPELLFLLRCARSLSPAFTIMEALQTSPLHLFFVLTDGEPGTQIIVPGYGLSKREALQHALLGFTARLQGLQHASQKPSEMWALFPELPLFTPATTSETTTCTTFSQEDTRATAADLLTCITGQGYDVLFADTTSSDICSASPWRSGVFLLRRAKAQTF